MIRSVSNLPARLGPPVGLGTRMSGGTGVALASLFPVALMEPPPAYLVITGLTASGPADIALAGGAAAAMLFSRQGETGRYFSPANGYFDEIIVEESVARRLTLRTADTPLAAELQAESLAALFTADLDTPDAVFSAERAVSPAAAVPVESSLTAFAFSSDDGTAQAAQAPAPGQPENVPATATVQSAPMIADNDPVEPAIPARTGHIAVIPIQEIASQGGAAAIVAESAAAPQTSAIPVPPEANAAHSGSAISHTIDLSAGLSAPLMAAAFGPGGTSQGGYGQPTTTTTTATTTAAAAAVDVSHIAADISAEVVNGAKTIALSSLFTVTASTSNPTYLILSVLDRDEYTASASGAVGSISGNGHTTSLTAASGDSDSRTLGIVFTYDTANGRYYNSTYGYFDALTYTASSSAGDVTDLAVYATDSASVASKYANDTYTLTVLDSGGYVATTTVATEASFTGTVPSQATPSSIEAIAKTFIGDAWNMNGCWTLASTIAAEAGASLPVASTYVGSAGQAGGEWIVAYDGPVSASSNWESTVTAGEFVVFETTSGTGHITFVVSGSGSTAKLIDNVTYENTNGTIENSANDGSSDDIIVSAAHLASQEFSGVSASSVVIYELDTPIVTALVTADTLALKASQSLSLLFSVTDPAHKTITEFEIYNTNTADTLSVNGSIVSAHTAATAAESSSLSGVSLVAGATAGTDTIDVRAYNGTYWGDWDAVTLTVSGSTTSTTPTTTTTTTTNSTAGLTVATTAAQTATDGTAYSHTLASGTFTDTAGLAYTTAAYQTSGISVVSWLHYNSTTQTLSGTVPTGLTGSITLDIVATDTAGHTASDIFTLSFLGGAVSVVSVVGAATSGSTEHLTLG